jgi:hypothetical protein
VSQVLRLDLISKLVVDLALECEHILPKVHVHYLGLRLRLEYPSEVLKVLNLAVKEELVVRELIVLIACDVSLDLKGHTTRHI